MAGTKRRYGTGLYRRGNVFWLKVRTPAELANLLPREFLRLSLRTTSEPEALAAARIVRAALDAGFATVGARMRAGTITAAEAEAVIAAVGRRALAGAEAVRALAGPRPEEAILAAQRAHVAEAEAWRGVLRRNDLGAVLPLVAAAAAETGLDNFADRPGPALLREAARMMAVVADENARREDGHYAGDRDQMLARLAGRKAESCGAAAETASPGTIASLPRPKDGTPPGGLVVIEGGGAGAQAPVDAPDYGVPNTVARPILAAEDGARTRASSGRQVAAMSDADVQGRSSCVAETVAPRPLPLPVSEGSPSSIRARPRPDLEVPSQPASMEMVPAILEPPGQEIAVTHAARPNTTSRPVPTSGGADLPPIAASDAVAPIVRAPKPRKESRKAERRAAPDPAVAELRKRPPAELWNMTIEEAFKYAEAKLSGSGTNKKWIKGSQRGFRATGKLATTFFGNETKLRDISHGDCLNFVESLALIPDTWGKSPDTRLPMGQLIQGANDLEDYRLCVIEHQANTEGWSDERFVEACATARIDRLAPRTQFKHQCYVGQVFKIVIEAAEGGKSPMRGAIWSRKERDKRIAEGGVRRVALGKDGRASLFATTLFREGPQTDDDPLFWLPLLGRYQGLRMEEGCQLKPKDVGEVDGVPVIFIRASEDQSVKSPSSIRTLPIHSELIRLGFLRLVERKRSQGARWILGIERHEDGSFSTRYSRLYHNWRRAEGIYEAGRDFHSLRKDFYQDLRSGRVDYAARMVLMGHALNDISEKHYGGEWDMGDMQDFICRIPVDTAHVRPVA